MIAIINYGSGNIRAITNILGRLDAPYRIVSMVSELAGAEKFILPGVGAFDETMGQLEASGLQPALNELVQGKKIPVLGICVGMQILAESSEEGTKAGLGWIKGAVRKFRPGAGGARLSLPHMGWNDVNSTRPTRLFAHLEQDARFYFLHSYYFDCAQAESAIATTEYGGAFACAVNHDNVYGVQFHPEKSHHFGVQLIRNFAEL
jgi:glutamine amidotransferase